MAAPVANNPQYAATSTDTTTPWTLASYNVPSGGTNKRLVVCVFAESDGTYAITGVSFGSDTLSKRVGLHQQGAFQTVEIWEKVNPTVQTANIDVAFSGTPSLGRSAVCALYLTDASQTDAVDASDTDYNASAQPTAISVTTTVDDCLLIAAWNDASTAEAWTVGTGFTAQVNQDNPNSCSMAILVETKAAGTAGVKTFNATQTAYQRCTVAAIAVAPATGGGGTAVPVFLQHYNKLRRA